MWLFVFTLSLSLSLWNGQKSDETRPHMIVKRHDTLKGTVGKMQKSWNFRHWGIPPILTTDRSVQLAVGVRRCFLPPH